MRKREAIRWWIIAILALLLFVLLAYRLYDLTILQGDEFSKLSESRRTREIQIAAPRGNIYDRNGVLLAGTRTSYTVQGYKDEFLHMSSEERAAVLSRLICLIERDGSDYNSDFPLGVNRFSYGNESQYFKESESPTAKAQRLLKENNLIASWISKVYSNGPDGFYRSSPAARALSAMSLKGAGLPIKCDPDDNFKLSFVEGEEYRKLIEDEEITEETGALDYLAEKIGQNENIFSHTINHPASAKLAYDTLKEAGKEENLELSAYIFNYYEEYILKKAALHKSFSGISENTDPKEDFVSIVKATALDKFLESISVSKDNKFHIPAEAVINKLSDMGVNSNLKYSISEDAKSTRIEFINDEDSEEKPLDRLKKLALEKGVLDAIIVDDSYKQLAQEAMFAEGVYPGISIHDWTYASQKSHLDFIKANKLEDKNSHEAFKELSEKKYIKEDTDPCLSLGILMLNSNISQPGTYAYWPSNLCYELSYDTVAKIEENIPLSSGIMVSRQPIRYYPFGESACHILGYIGKIATENEIENYVKKAGYLPNELIGKTGVEESFEDTLHGVSGKEVVMVDSSGNRTETIERKEAKAGNNIYLSIDINLQKQSELSVKNSILAVKHGRSYMSPWGNSETDYSPTVNSGASVSVDPQNGELLAMASYPMYDPNLFVTGISASDWDLYQTDSALNPDAPKPLMNLATQTSVQPGSTFKTIVGLTALELGMDPRTSINCQGFVQIGNRRFNCLIYTLTGGSHGYLNLADALGVSCNYYFYVLGLGKLPYNDHELGFHVGVDELNDTLIKLGLDKTSSLEINQPQETRNNIPSREGKLGLSKALLKRFLEANLALYKKDDIEKKIKDIESDISTIVKWSEEGEIGRTDLIQRLDSLGYKAEEALEGKREGLADILKYTYFNQSYWTVADTMNTVIGQGQNAYTPISMARVSMLFANKGTNYNLTLIRQIRTSDNSKVLFEQEAKGKKVDIAESSFDAIREGMRRSAEHSAAAFKNLNMQIGSKTGTAQRGGIDPRTKNHYASYAWDIAFAPFDQAKIATVSFMPAGEMSLNVTPISRDVIASYLGVRPVQQLPKTAYEGLKTYYPEKEEIKEESSQEEPDRASGQ